MKPLRRSGRFRWLTGSACVVSAVALAACGAAAQPGAAATTPISSSSASATDSASAAVSTSAAVSASAGVSTASAARPLAGLVIAIDPGHNLGNSTHLRQINRRVWVGFWKECNTTGTSTSSGYPEASFAWDVSLRIKHDLERLGARVVLTRYSNTRSSWGPCVDYRGRFGKAQKAVLKVSIHGDGAKSSGRGFHVIEPAYLRGYTSDIVKPSARLGAAMKKGLIAGGITPSTYIRGAISVRRDLGTLTMSDIPTVMTELGNMRNSRDSGLMRSRAGRQKYAAGVERGIRLYLHR